MIFLICATCVPCGCVLTKLVKELHRLLEPLVIRWLALGKNHCIRELKFFGEHLRIRLDEWLARCSIERI